MTLRFSPLIDTAGSPNWSMPCDLVELFDAVTISEAIPFEERLIMPGRFVTR
jgi:hypothetical protein